ASLRSKARTRLTCYTFIRRRSGRVWAPCWSMRWKSLRAHAVPQNLLLMPATAHVDFSEKEAMSPSSATLFPLATSGSPTPRGKNSSPLNGRLHDQTRHAVPASLALLHRAQIRGARCRCGDRALCNLLVVELTAMNRRTGHMG